MTKPFYFAFTHSQLRNSFILFLFFGKIASGPLRQTFCSSSPLEKRHRCKNSLAKVFFLLHSFPFKVTYTPQIVLIFNLMLLFNFFSSSSLIFSSSFFPQPPPSSSFLLLLPPPPHPTFTLLLPSSSFPHEHI